MEIISVLGQKQALTLQIMPDWDFRLFLRNKSGNKLESKDETTYFCGK